MTRVPVLYIKKIYKNNLGVMIQKNIHYLQYQLVMQKQQQNTVPPSITIDKISPKKSYNCSLSILESSFHFICDYRDVHALVNCIEE